MTDRIARLREIATTIPPLAWVECGNFLPEWTSACGRFTIEHVVGAVASDTGWLLTDRDRSGRGRLCGTVERAQDVAREMMAADVLSGELLAERELAKRKGKVA